MGALTMSTETTKRTRLARVRASKHKPNKRPVRTLGEPVKCQFFAGFVAMAAVESGLERAGPPNVRPIVQPVPVQLLGGSWRLRAQGAAAQGAERRLSFLRDPSCWGHHADS